MNALLSLLDFASVWVVFLPVLIGIALCRFLTLDSKYVLVISVFACVPQFLHAINASSSIKAITYNGYTIIEFVIWWFFFRAKFEGANKIAFNVSAVLYMIGIIILFWLFNERFINEAVCLNNLIFTMWSLLLIQNSFVEDSIEIEFQNSLLWYLSVLLLYSVCSFLVFSFWYYRHNGYPIINQIKTIHSVLNVLLYVGFCGGFIADFYKKTVSPKY